MRRRARIPSLENWLGKLGAASTPPIAVSRVLGVTVYTRNRLAHSNLRISRGVSPSANSPRPPQDNCSVCSERTPGGRGRAALARTEPFQTSRRALSRPRAPANGASSVADKQRTRQAGKGAGPVKTRCLRDQAVRGITSNGQMIPGRSGG